MDLMPEDMYGYDDYEITFDDAYMVFSDWGYNLTQEVFDMLKNMDDPSMLEDYEWEMLYDTFGSQDQDYIMTTLGDIMMSLYPEDMYGEDWVPSFPDVENAFMDYGYYLTDAVYDILINMEDPSMLNQTAWDMLYETFNTQDQEEIMSFLDSIFMNLMPDDMYYEGDDWVPTYDDISMVFSEYGY